MTTDDLDQRLLVAHEAGDKRSLVTLYEKAAAGANDLDATCFYLTHAYIFALELGDPRSAGLHRQLKSHGRET